MKSFQEVLEDQERRMNAVLETLQSFDGSIPPDAVQDLLDAMEDVAGHTTRVGVIQLGIRA